MTPKIHPCPNPRICECYLIWQKGLANVIKLTLLRWGEYLAIFKYPREFDGMQEESESEE